MWQWQTLAGVVAQHHRGLPTAVAMQQAVTARAITAIKWAKRRKIQNNNQTVVTATAKAVRGAAVVMQPMATSTATASTKNATINQQQHNKTLMGIGSGVAYCLVQCWGYFLHQHSSKWWQLTAVVRKIVP